MALIWVSSTSTGRPDRCAFFNKKSPERIFLNQFWHCLSFQASFLYMRYCLFGNTTLTYVRNVRLVLPFLNWDNNETKLLIHTFFFTKLKMGVQLTRRQYRLGALTLLTKQKNVLN